MAELAGSDYSPVTPVKGRTVRRSPMARAVRGDASALARSAASPTTSIQKVVVTMATCLLLALLLNARAVAHDTAGMPDGAARTVLLAIGQTALSVASATHLTWPRDMLDAALGHTAQPVVPPLLATGPGATPPPRAGAALATAAPTPTSEPTRRPRPTPSPTARRPVSAHPRGRATPTPPHPPTQPTIGHPSVRPAPTPSALPTSGHPSSRPSAVPPLTQPAPGHPASQASHGHPSKQPASTQPPKQPASTQPPKQPAPGHRQKLVASGPPLRQPTAAHPLRLLVTGDSLPGYLGPELVNAAAAAGPVLGFVDVHDGTGLTRPDFVDWSLLARQQVAADNPDAVVVWIGGNDFQNMTLPNGAFFQAGTPAWTREYERRAEICMRIWARGGTRRVYWLSMPPARNSDWARDDAQINSALRRAAARVPGAEYLDILGPITNHGRYADYVYDAHGQPVLVRESDGVHVNIAGSTLVAHAVLRVIVHEWRLGYKPAAAASTSHRQPPAAPAAVLLTDVHVIGHPERVFHMGMPRLYCWVRNSTLPAGTAALTVRWTVEPAATVIDQVSLPRSPGAYTMGSDGVVDKTPGAYRCAILSGGQTVGSAGFTVIP